MRLSHVFLLVVIFALGSFVYSTANHYQSTEKQLAKIERAMDREHENIRVLRAEWAYLTSPQRMEKLARDYLALQAMNGTQLVALSSVPMRDTMESMANKDKPQQDERAVTSASSMPTAMPAAMPAMQALPISAGGGQ